MFKPDLCVLILGVDVSVVHLRSHELITGIIGDYHSPKASRCFRQPILIQGGCASNNRKRLLSKEVTVGNELIHLIPLQMALACYNSLEPLNRIFIHVLKVAHFTECMCINSRLSTKNPFNILGYDLR